MDNPSPHRSYAVPAAMQGSDGFDDIRPYRSEEVPDVLRNLLQDPEFQAVVAYIARLTGQQPDALAQAIGRCRSTEDFQIGIIYPFLQQLLAQATTSISANFSAVAPADAAPDAASDARAYTFVSNHRDIVLDSALLSFLLHDHGMKTVEIAIGDNLLIRPWIKDLVRVNKAFIVQRALTMRQMLLASAKLSRYVRYAVTEKHENIWIAQREGRAKDSDDRTQESVLKMLAIGGDLRQLNIVPLAITYEYDPCDHLKAQEFQLKRDNPGFKKSPQDDLDNMRTGIFGPKGKVHYHAAPPLNRWIETLPTDISKNDFFPAVAQRIDQQIHSHYHLYPGNYVAADMLRESSAFAHHYTQQQALAFKDYIAGKLQRVSLPQPDVPFLTERMLTMYANPVFNQQHALA